MSARPHIRGKDAVNVRLLICEMAAYHKRQGKTLWQVWGELEGEYGIYTGKPCFFTFPDADGFSLMCEIMEHLRNHPSERIAGTAARRIIDYRESEKIGLPVSDVLAFHLEDGGRASVRPSGKEPKMKAYLAVKSSTKADGIERFARMEKSEN